MKTPEQIAEFVKDCRDYQTEALDIIEQLQRQVAERDAAIASLGEICRVIQKDASSSLQELMICQPAMRTAALSAAKEQP